MEVMIPLVAENYAGAQACDVDPEGPSATDPVGARGRRVAAASYSSWRAARLYGETL